MRTSTPIYCPTCGNWCGTEYPARFSVLDGGEPGFSEGPGEDYEYNGDWYCSEVCMEEAIKREAED